MNEIIYEIKAYTGHRVTIQFYATEPVALGLRQRLDNARENGEYVQIAFPNGELVEINPEFIQMFHAKPIEWKDVLLTPESKKNLLEEGIALIQIIDGLYDPFWAFPKFHMNVPVNP